MARPRKFKTNAERQAAYRERVDRGTPELALHRVTAVMGGDPVLSTAPLDRLLARGVITVEENQAGWAYAVLFSKIYGRVFGPCSQYSDLVAAGSLVSAYADNLERDKGLLGAYYSMDSALKAAGQAARRAVRVVVIEHGEARIEDVKVGLKGLTCARG